MSLASEKLYNGYLRRNMPSIVSKVKVREIVVHLPCLTPHDRENIEAKRETYGNYDSMVLLLDCLRRRENWPEQFIEALEACEQPTLAAEIRAEYNALRGANNSNSSSPPATVVRAHVHAAPSASHVSIPGSGANSQAAAAPPAEASAPPEPAAQTSPPLETPVQPRAPQSSAAQVPEAVSPPEPPQSAPSTPPPSPDTPHTQTAAPPHREMNSHQEPVENSESDVQDVSGDDAVIPDQVSAGNGEVSISSVNNPQPSRPVEPCETHTPSPDPVQSAATSTEVRPPQSPSTTLISSDVTDGSSFLTVTPERPPVQDTNPPVDFKAAAVLQPEETSDPPAAQVVESSAQTEAAAATPPLPAAAGMDASLCDDISIHPQNHGSHDVPAPSSPLQPYSGNSERLEISAAAADAVTSARPPACSAVSSSSVTTASALPCQENGITLNHNEPEENHYESPCQSVDTQAVLENEVHVFEEPSILNLDGQISTPQVQIVNGEETKEISSAPPLSNNTALTSRTLTTNTKYILMAAGVGACALLMAWRFKN